MKMNFKPSVLQNTIYITEQACASLWEEFHSQQANNLQPGKTLTDHLRATETDTLKLKEFGLWMNVKANKFHTSFPKA